MSSLAIFGFSVGAGLAAVVIHAATVIVYVK
jgi:hypothetical protein